MRPILFDVYSRLEELPWIELGDFPTPIHRIDRFGEAVGLPMPYIKRDDMSSSLYGGNKVRKLEFVIADAKRKGRRTLITIGGTGSNQVLAAGIFGKRLGFKVVGVMMDQANADNVRRNLLLDHYFGVEIHHSPSAMTLPFSFVHQYLKHALLGERPYYVPSGASSPIGNVGFVNAAFELGRQVEEGDMPEPDYIVAEAGSMGTAAGLMLGCSLSDVKTPVVGVRVSMPWYVTSKRFASMVNRTCDFMRGVDPSIPAVSVSEKDVILLTEYLGEGYASFTDESVRTVDMMKKLENISLENTYTAKALGGGIDWLHREGLKDKVVLFWNTYNSVDLTRLIRDADYHDLPKSVHKYFEVPTQEELGLCSSSG